MFYVATFDPKIGYINEHKQIILKIINTFLVDINQNEINIEYAINNWTYNDFKQFCKLNNISYNVFLHTRNINTLTFLNEYNPEEFKLQKLSIINTLKYHYRNDPYYKNLYNDMYYKIQDTEDPQKILDILSKIDDEEHRVVNLVFYDLNEYFKYIFDT